MQTKKICFVVQRYGEKVNGGAELLCRDLAERLLPLYDVTVLTTCAVEYMTWANEYPAGESTLHGVRLIRFPVDHPRDPEEFGRYSAETACRPRTDEEERIWMEKQGPVSSALLRYLRKHKNDYAVFLFMTYLYYTTAMGLPLVADRAILIPTAHDEAPIYMRIFRPVFSRPRALFFLTGEERNFVHGLFHNESIPNELGGAGVELPREIDPQRFRDIYGLTGDYILYIGRIEPNKGCDEMFRFWKIYRARTKRPLMLTLMGKAEMPVPQRTDIFDLGFVSDKDKYDGLAGAKFLLLPSHQESLSMVVLESLALGVPVLVNGRCDVLREHCVRSNAGLYYTSYPEFEGCMNYLLDHPETARAMGENGPSYVRDNYSWETIIGRLSALIESV